MKILSAMKTEATHSLDWLASESPTEPAVSFAVMVEDQRFSIPSTAALVTAPLGFIAIFLLRERIRLRT